MLLKLHQRIENSGSHKSSSPTKLFTLHPQLICARLGFWADNMQRFWIADVSWDYYYGRRVHNKFSIVYNELIFRHLTLVE